MAKSAANRGKDAEAEVKKVLTKLALRTDTAFYRFPDARSGSRQPTLADYFLVHKGVTFLLEVKQVEHEYRLPHKNFEADQVARMRRFKLAGVSSVVLIYHTKLDKWRYSDIDFFLVREGGSWDLRSFELKDLSEILDAGETTSVKLEIGVFNGNTQSLK